MIVRSFLAWTATAPAASRAEGAAALALAYVDDELDPTDRCDAEAALTSLLDDRSPLVRLALAGVVADRAGVPHHIVTALAGDRADIAALVLEASPLLDATELVDAVATGCALTQAAIARRVGLPVGVAAALAEVGALPACLALCDNPTAAIAELSLRRLIERFGDDADLREAIGARPHLSPSLRVDLVTATAAALARFVTGCGWLSTERAERVVRDAGDQAVITIAAKAAATGHTAGAEGLVLHLRGSGRLTPALLLRALLCGNLPLFEAAVSNLSGVPLRRVAGLARASSGLGFAALYAKASLPRRLMPVFDAALRAACRDRQQDREAGTQLRRGIIAEVLDACARPGIDDPGQVTALLRTLDAQAAREEARAFSLDLARSRPAAPLLRASTEDGDLLLSSAA